MNKRSVGQKYEDIAASFLVKHGFEILERNYRCRMGEIDIIFQDGKYLVFCEVKYRSTKAYGYPSEAVTKSKVNTIRRVAQFYLLEHHMRECFMRFDVIAILGEEIEYIPNAF